MLHILISYFISILLILSNPSNDYQKIFGADYIDALNYFVKNKTVILDGLNKYQADPELIVPIIFPERVRYSIIRDIIETVAVEDVYIEYGPDYVDFSIGPFQLKPTFASKIENALIDSSILRKKYMVLLKYKKTDLKGIRKERVERLRSQEFQLTYISAFYDIVSQRFDLSDKTTEEKIAFIATTYNYGFLSDKAEIEAHINDTYFPYGAKYKGKQYSYSDVAAYFYRNHYHQIFD
jgi:hypothetical protein